eukprot:TRINITY_DN5071_c0_g1_i1.p1 TRINITY_DN5071_c0_g1~~TRINITY_DN5071_c0_g1_i1.p1  ORF type:complete len:385 (+),score=121.39 TRINITY_DN5071_c0_g1_i1:107-1156(+)
MLNVSGGNSAHGGVEVPDPTTGSLHHQQSQRGLKSLEGMDLVSAVQDNDPNLFAQTLIEVAGEGFAVRVMQNIRALTNTTAPPTARRRESIKDLKSARGAQNTSKQNAVFKKLAFQTHYRAYELEQLFQQFKDIISDEPFSDKHMRMFFSQNGLGQRLIDLIVQSLRFDEDTLACTATPATSTAPTTGRPGSRGQPAGEPMPLVNTQPGGVQTASQQELSKRIQEERELQACCACVHTLSILKKGTNEERMYFYCKLFDFNADGVLEPHELRIFSEVMHDSYLHHRRMLGRVDNPEEEDRAKEAIQVLLEEIVAEVQKTPEGGVKIDEVLHHHKLLKLWDLLKLTGVNN